MVSTNLHLPQCRHVLHVCVRSIAMYMLFPTAADALALLLRGSANRRIAETRMNKHSSRSHCVFTCRIESRVEEDGDVRLRAARLHLVDLAGSERQKRTQAQGERLREATAINKSLSALGLVIKKLSERQGGHVPYRDAQVWRMRCGRMIMMMMCAAAFH